MSMVRFIHGSLFKAFLPGGDTGDSCDWLLVALLALTPQAQDTPTAKRQRTPPCVGCVSLSICIVSGVK